MSRIPQTFIDDLLNSVDIVEVIDMRVQLKKAGKEYKACCPFHNEKTPSFSVSQTKQFYHCFGCGANGNAVSFLMDYEHLSFPETIHTLASIAGVSVPEEQNDNRKHQQQQTLYDVLAATSQYYQQQLRHHQDKQLAIDYLKQRGLSGKTAKRFNIGYAPQGWDNLTTDLPNVSSLQLIAAGLRIKKSDNDSYDRFRNRIMFPIHDRRGRVIAFGGRVLTHEDEPKYLNSPETEVFHKRRELYGLYEVLQTNRNIHRIIVVEGYMDVIMLAEHNINYAVATLGTATTEEHLKQLFRHTNDITFCFDGDRAGYDAAWKALNVTLPILDDGIQINFMFLAQGEDPDSTIRAEGKTGFEKRIDNALPLAKFIFKHLTKNIAMERLDGQAKLVKLALPLLQQIPGQILRHKLLDELATHAQVSMNQLESMLETKIHNEPVTAIFAKSSHHQPSLMQQAISILLQQPELGAEVLDLSYWKKANIAGSKLFAELVEIIQQQPQINTGAIIEHWRGKTEYNHLGALAARELLTPDLGLKTEFHDILSRLRKTQLEQQLNILQRKAKQGELNNDDRQEYLTLLAQKV